MNMRIQLEKLRNVTMEFIKIRQFQSHAFGVAIRKRKPPCERKAIKTPNKPEFRPPNPYKKEAAL
jgi:hypothetical protein